MHNNTDKNLMKPEKIKYEEIKAINLSDDEEEYEDTIDEEPQDTPFLS